MDNIEEVHPNVFSEVIKRTNAIDSQTNWIFLNRIWYSPEFRKLFIPFFTKFIDDSLIGINNPLIFVPEGLSSSYGILPFVSVYVNQKELYMLLWREFGDILTITPFIFPEPDKVILPDDANLIIIQDVVGNGSLLYKIAKDIGKYKKNWKINSLLVVIQQDDQKSELDKVLEHISVEQGVKIQFKSMMPRSMILEGMK